jgi:hypothetical protein
LPACNILSIERPLATASDEAALLVEWALKISVLIPAVLRKVLIHLPIVLPVTARKGAIREMNSMPS